MSKALTHYIVAAYVADLQEVGFFLVPREFDGVEIAENWNMVGMRATESHDLVLNDVWVPKTFRRVKSHNRMAGYCIFQVHI